MNLGHSVLRHPVPYLSHSMNENSRQPPKFGSPEIPHKQHREPPPPCISQSARKQTFFFFPKDCSKYQVCNCSQQLSVYIFLYSGGYVLFSKTTFYRKQILPGHIPENQYLNSLIEEVILEISALYHLPKDRASL